MNSEFAHHQSDVWARRLINDLPQADRRIRNAYQAAYGRPVAEDELQLAANYLAGARERLKASGIAETELDQQALASYLRALLASNEFLFVD